MGVVQLPPCREAGRWGLEIVVGMFSCVFAWEGGGESETGLWDTVRKCLGVGWRRTGMKVIIRKGTDSLWGGKTLYGMIRMAYGVKINGRLRIKKISIRKCTDGLRG